MNSDVIDPFCGAGGFLIRSQKNVSAWNRFGWGGTMWQEIVQWWWSIAPYLKTPAPIVISLIALSVTFWDRRPRLLVRPRKGSTHNPYNCAPRRREGWRSSEELRCTT